jgi:hypothetical protein
MHVRFASIAGVALLVTGLGTPADPAPPNTAAASVVVYKSPT